MAQHENKNFPMCLAPIECKVDSILQCQGNGVAFTENEWDYINHHHADCLYTHCLQQIKHEISTTNAQQKMQALLAQIKNK